MAAEGRIQIIGIGIGQRPRGRAARVVNQDVVTRITHHVAQRLAVVKVDGSGSVTRSGQILHGGRQSCLIAGEAVHHRTARGERLSDGLPQTLGRAPHQRFSSQQGIGTYDVFDKILRTGHRKKSYK